ncbi:NAD+ kinase [Jatrophihabitans sp. GAS493]|uniref:NAD kinase n=1 Tax=Jatrophihabitans sp. GAS493 TaxID=1907575 RepID=UPI000BB816C1|nr:NAD+ kinase [Jatrophihabitans sp. GAS493]
MTRSAVVVAHTGRKEIRSMATSVVSKLTDAGFEVRMLAAEAADCEVTDEVTIVDGPHAAAGAEILLTFGGDGTFLRASELARPAAVPMIGVNFGHVGFLAEAEPDEFDETVASIVARRYSVEERTTVDVEVSSGGMLIAEQWALNEASVEKASRERILEAAVSVDERPLLRFGCDGVLCATPTGSTAYAFSAGGPIVWPNVDAFLVVPNAAHAVFSRPIIVAPHSVVDVELISPELPAVLSCDGRRSVALPPQARIRFRRGKQSVLIARAHEWNFGERLVTKFQLPVRGFRGM